jgi:DNA-binding Lrp family transcriptional regulator
MKQVNGLSLESIKKIYYENDKFLKVNFMSNQSLFLSDVYKTYFNDIYAANIILYFSKNFHEKILRKRDFILDFNISLESFWENQNDFKIDSKVANISKDLNLPRETTRRKIKELIKGNVLKKNGSSFVWDHPFKNKKKFNNIYESQINTISKFILLLARELGYETNIENIQLEIKKNFSFFWFHFLQSELKYLKIWQNNLGDLELLILSIECFMQCKNPKQQINTSMITKFTGIPRATCIRKIKTLAKKKIIKKDFSTGKYYFDFESLSNPFMNKEIDIKVVDVFCEFLLIISQLINKKS